MFSKAVILSVLALGSISTATPFQTRQTDAGVGITNLSQNVNSTGGSGNVAAAGSLSPFGGIGVGCGINWQSDVSYGGGIQAGSEAFGLGGGFTIKPDSIEVGTGIGLNSANASANIQFSGTTTGIFELIFESSSQIVCTPGSQDGKSVVRCVTV
ncbi:hypothetical protein BKA66DRAFT_293482 [Pyrenochaeta sp. MPI-SDFR-AT-0127]|nr:hypothetical protein BKA66DRAFT_293482 [Pyrenochaeta sp. MPI-SDFR-AT-0127]